MRGKRAKELRRLAQALTAGQPQHAYVRHKVRGNIMLGECTRALYQRLKRNLRRVERGESAAAKILQRLRAAKG